MNRTLILLLLIVLFAVSVCFSNGDQLGELDNRARTNLNQATKKARTCRTLKQRIGSRIVAARKLNTLIRELNKSRGDSSTGETPSGSGTSIKDLAFLRDKQKFLERAGSTIKDYTKKLASVTKETQRHSKRIDELKSGRDRDPTKELSDARSELSLKKSAYDTARKNADNYVRLAKNENVKRRAVGDKMTRANREWRKYGCNASGLDEATLRSRVQQFKSNNPDVAVTSWKEGKTLRYKISGIGGRSWGDLLRDKAAHTAKVKEYIAKYDKAKARKETIMAKIGVLEKRILTLSDKVKKWEQELQAQETELRDIGKLSTTLLSHVSEWERDLDRLDKITNQVNRVLSFQKNIASEQKAIASLRLATRAKDFDEWEKLSKEARKELQKQALDALLDLAFMKASAINKPHGSLNAGEIEDVIRKLKKVKVKDARLATRIQALSKLKDKKSKADALDALLNSLGKKKDVLMLAASAGDSPTPELDAVAMLLGWKLSNPTLQLLIIDLKLTTSAVYNNYAQRVSRKRIEELTKLTEVQLEILKVHNKRIKAHVKNLLNAKADLEKLFK